MSLDYYINFLQGRIDSLNKELSRKHDKSLIFTLMPEIDDPDCVLRDKNRTPVSLPIEGKSFAIMFSGENLNNENIPYIARINPFKKKAVILDLIKEQKYISDALTGFLESNGYSVCYRDFFRLYH